MTVKEAIKKLQKRQKYLSSIGCPVDRRYESLIRDLEKHPGFTPMDSPRVKDEEND